MSWEYKTLDELGTISRGKSKHRPRNDASLFGGKYPFVQTADVKAANLYLTEYESTYNDKGLSQSKLWEVGTLCITIAANIADTAILGIDACFPDSIMGFQPYEGISNVKFIKYSFDMLQKDCKQISQGAAQDNLSWNKLSTIKFPAPDIAIQNKIADMLSVYDDLIENNQKQIKLLEEAAQRLYKEWFVDMRFPGYKDCKIVDGVPEGWERKKISDLGEIVTGKTPSTSKEQYYGGDIPFVKIPDMHGCVYPIATESTLTKEGADTQKNKFIPKNGIMVSCIATVGLVNIAVEPCQTNQQINSIILSNEDDVYYVYSTMRRLKTMLDGVGSNGATMTNVNKTKFGNIKIFYPDEQLRKAYYVFCKPIFEKIFALSMSNNKLAGVRDRLLPKLMNGEIEV
ncbi:restriction endonuclease subunit S [Oribacterium sp. WCC10]|uniref:restriction endonuclease subunit S n=1 Tax=Oribacterium sp. WCC10 TaxID=1855343 RepID=UPI0008E8DC34|nr:restriction endonuclease subunit S [Oribacterium sp. WCC10]SFG73117.1 type I restriction enzyme, S subunit [Oribacterium sp. WCC10]